MQDCAASNIVSHAVPATAALAEDGGMPRKTSAAPRPALQPHKLKAWRVHAGLTQAEMVEELAKRNVTISEGQLSRIENLKSPYLQYIVEAWADVVQTDTASVLSRSPDAAVVVNLTGLDPDQAKQVSEYADFIKRKA